MPRFKTTQTTCCNNVSKWLHAIFPLLSRWTENSDLIRTLVAALVLVVVVVVAAAAWGMWSLMFKHRSEDTFTGHCSSSLNTPMITPGTFSVSSFRKTEPPPPPPPATGDDVQPNVQQPPTSLTSAVDKLKSYSSNCLQEAVLSTITQSTPLQKGAPVQARLGAVYNLPTSDASQYHSARVVQYLSKGERLFGPSSMGSGFWTSKAGGSDVLHPFNDPFDPQEVLNTLTDASVPPTTTLGPNLKRNGFAAFTPNPAVGLYPGMLHQERQPPSTPAITTYTSPHDGYVLSFENADVQARYEAQSLVNPTYRVVDAADVIPMPNAKTVDTCVSGCMNQTGFRTTHVQVGACDQDGCKCMCVPAASGSSDDCAASLQPSLPEAPYSVYQVDTNISNQNLLMEQLRKSAPHSETGLHVQADHRTVCAQAHGGDSTPTASSGDCGCKSACELMNGSGTHPDGTHLCSSTSDLERVLNSVPKAVEVRTGSLFNACSSNGASSSECMSGNRPKACPLQFTKGDCEANPQCEWTNQPYKYSVSTTDSSTLGEDPNCPVDQETIASATTPATASEFETETIYKCITKPPHGTESTTKPRMYTLTKPVDSHVDTNRPRLFGTVAAIGNLGAVASYKTIL
jgi:hypothetical protein